MKILLILITAIYLSFPVNAYCGPFGVNMGDPEEKFADPDSYWDRRELDDFTIYRSVDIPKAHPLFYGYSYWFKNKKLCAIDGVTNWLSKDQANEVIDILKDKLTDKYGEIFKIINNDAVHDLKSIKDKTNLFIIYWKPPKNNIDNLEQVELNLSYTSYRGYVIDLRYVFKNYFKKTRANTYNNYDDSL